MKKSADRIVVLDSTDTIIDIVPLDLYDLETIHDAMAFVNRIKDVFTENAKKERLRHVKKN